MRVTPGKSTIAVVGSAGRRRRARAARSRAVVGAGQPTHAGHAVGPGLLLDRAEPALLDLVEGDEHLAARVVPDAVLLAELPQHPDALAAQGRLERAGLVVETGVHDAAVAAGLVCGEPVLLLPERDGAVGVDLLEAAATAAPRMPPPTTAYDEAHRASSCWSSHGASHVSHACRFVLAEQWRGHGRGRGGAVVAQRPTGHGDVSQCGVREVVHEAEVVHLFPVVDLGHGPDPPGRDARVDELGDDVGGLAVREQRLDLGLQLLDLRHAQRIGRDVGPVVGDADDGGEPAPQRLRADGDHQAGVGAAEGAVRRDGRVPVAGADRVDAGGQPAGALERVHRGDRREQAGLHRPADTGALALVQRRHHAEGAEHAGEEVGDRQADPRRLAVAGAGQAHQPGLGLHDLVEPGTVHRRGRRHRSR